MQWVIVCVKWPKSTAESRENARYDSVYFFLVLWLDFWKNSIYSGVYVSLKYMKPVRRCLAWMVPRIQCPTLNLRISSYLKALTVLSHLWAHMNWDPSCKEKGIPLWFITSRCSNLLGIKKKPLEILALTKLTSPSFHFMKRYFQQSFTFIFNNYLSKSRNVLFCSIIS